MLSTVYVGYSQNLVKNPSFENIDSCNVIGQNQYDNLFHCEDWFHTYDTWSVDFFHPCMPTPFLDPPSLGSDMYSYAFDQDAFLGLVFYEVGYNIREVASSMLTDSLMKDSVYCFSMHYKNSRWYNCNYWIDNIGVCFTNDTITYNEVRTLSPSIRTESGIQQNTNDWIELKGWFIAKGGERFINIGSFGADSETNGDFTGVNPASGTSAYYLIDDLNLEHCSIHKINRIEIPNVFTPNLDGKNDLFEIEYGNFITIQMVVYNRWGELINQLDLLNDDWDGTNMKGDKVSSGVYFVTVNGETILGETITKSQFVHLFE